MNSIVAVFFDKQTGVSQTVHWKIIFWVFFSILTFILDAISNLVAEYVSKRDHKYKICKHFNNNLPLLFIVYFAESTRPVLQSINLFERCLVLLWK